jgi:uncharacterized protein YndB with AHSA1/START domain
MARGAAATIERIEEWELATERVVHASRVRVWRAWTEPEQLARWWGPKGFRNTFDEHDPRPGGRWRFVMHGPDGTDYRNECVYVELLRPERIVIDHVSGPRFRLTATLVEEPGGTRVTWRQTFETAEECARVRGFAAPANEENLDRLEAVLARE